MQQAVIGSTARTPIGETFRDAFNSIVGVELAALDRRLRPRSPGRQRRARIGGGAVADRRFWRQSF
jgi:hypothetical protein